MATTADPPDSDNSGQQDRMPGSAAKCERCGHGWDRHSDNGGPKGTRNWCRGIPYAGGCDCTEPTPDARAEGRAAAAAWNAYLGRDE